MLTRPGFRLAIAKEGDEHVGFAYGYLLPRDTRWWNGLSEELSRDFTCETGSRTFAIIDFGMLLAYRGKGIGKAFHDSILAASGAQRAALSVQPKATETQNIYRRWGWPKIG
jgi:GNAT superfamily N-acetyltransferase